MGKYSAKGGADFEPVPAGAYRAVCTLVADIGLQDGGNFGPKRKIVFRFEIPDERVKYEKDGKEVDAPAIIYDTLTASMNKKANMRAMLEGWRGKSFTDEQAEAFDTQYVLGAACFINVIHNRKGDKVYANIQSIMPLPKGMEKPKAVAELIYFHIDEDDSAYEKLPKWIQKKADEALEDAPPTTGRTRESVDDEMASQAHDRFEDSDIPF